LSKCPSVMLCDLVVIVLPHAQSTLLLVDVDRMQYTLHLC
jgi:hypothetical protein